MFINYEHEGHVYNVEVERKGEEYAVTYNGNTYIARAVEVKPGHLKIQVGDESIKCVISEVQGHKFIFVDGEVFKVRPVGLTGAKKSAGAAEESGDLKSPISGKVVKVGVKVGDSVKKGDVLMVIEAMKMEYLIKAPYEGTVEKVNFKENEQIDIGQITVELKKAEEG